MHCERSFQPAVRNRRKQRRVCAVFPVTLCNCLLCFALSLSILLPCNVIKNYQWFRGLLREHWKTRHASVSFLYLELGVVPDRVKCHRSFGTTQNEDCQLRTRGIVKFYGLRVISVDGDFYIIVYLSLRARERKSNVGSKFKLLGGRVRARLRPRYSRSRKG